MEELGGDISVVETIIKLALLSHSPPSIWAGLCLYVMRDGMIMALNLINRCAVHQVSLKSIYTFLRYRANTTENITFLAEAIGILVTWK